MIPVTITLKARIYLTCKQALMLHKLMRQYTKSCRYCSKLYFNSGESLSQTKLHNKTYRILRNEYGLKSQLAESVPKAVLARYRSVNSLMKEHAYHFRDNNTKKWYRVFKDARWIWHPINFHSLQADEVAGRDWSISKDRTKVTLNTLSKRITVPCCVPKYFKRYFDVKHKLGTSKILHRRGKWYFYISCTVDRTDFDYHKQTKNTVGIDRGLRFIAYAYDSHKHSVSFKGLSARRKRMRFLKQRAILQNKGTKASKRKLKELSGRENRWMSDVNHQISKALVQHYGKRTTFVLEDLRGVRFSTENVSKEYRYTQVSWPFYKLELMLDYKARLHQCTVIKINPQYTSQRCPNCGRVQATNRNHHKHVYRCQYCGYTSNDDRIGAMNIRWLGVQKVHAKSKEKRPRIIPERTVNKNKQLSLF